MCLPELRESQYGDNLYEDNDVRSPPRLEYKRRKDPINLGMTGYP